MNRHDRVSGTHRASTDARCDYEVPQLGRFVAALSSRQHVSPEERGRRALLLVAPVPEAWPSRLGDFDMEVSTQAYGSRLCRRAPAEPVGRVSALRRQRLAGIAELVSDVGQ